MKGKIKTTLLITVLLLSTIAGLAIPTSMASTSIEANYILCKKGDDGAAAGWYPAPGENHGDFSPLLEAPAAENDEAKAMVHPPSGITLDTLDITKLAFDYYSMSGSIPDLELRFEAPDCIDADDDTSTDRGHADITIDSLGTTTGTDDWYTTPSITGASAICYGNAPLTGDDLFTGGMTGTYDAIKAAIIDLDSDYADWELTRVSVQVGWAEYEVYVDSVVIEDETYDLEPQSLVAGTSYNILWRTRANEVVDLKYNPEGQGLKINRQDNTGSDARITFYGVTPTYAGNWTLSELYSVPEPDEPLTQSGLVEMTLSYDYDATNDATETAWFIVQPQEDLTVSLSESTLDVTSGTVTLTVTVTSDTEPVGNAYISVEFWNNKAKHFDTEDTILLRIYETKTASNGMAMFDIEVPEVAGTIYVTAGTDSGPEDPVDGEYFENWGYATIPVEPADYTLTVSPSTIYKAWTAQAVTVTVEYEDEPVIITGISYEFIGCGIDMSDDDTTDGDGKFTVIVDDGGPTSTGNIAITVGHDEDDDGLYDYVGTSTITVATAAKFNVAVEPIEIDAATSTDVTVTFFDKENNGPDGDESNLLDTVKVTLSGPGVSLESGDYDGTGETKGDATASTAKTLTFSVTPEQAGTLTVTFDAVFDDEPEETKSLTVDVTGYKLTVDITELTVGDIEAVTVTVLNKNGIPVGNADVVLDDPLLVDEFKIGEVTYDLLRIDGDDYKLYGEGPTSIGTITPIQNGNYIFPDVEFTKPASIHVIAYEPYEPMVAPMAELLDEIKVFGEVAYDITTDPATLVAGIINTEFIVFVVDSEGDPVTDLDTVNLETVTTGLIITSEQGNNKITTGANYDSDEDDVNDAYKFTEVVVNGEGLIRVFTSNNDGASIGILEVPVILPEVTILPEDGLLTEWLEETVDVTIRDPRDGELVSSADLKITITNMKAYVKWGDTGEAELATGSASKTWSGIEGEQSFTILCHDVETSEIGTVLFEVCDIEIATYDITDMTADVTPETAYVGVNTIVSITLSDAHESAVAGQTVELYYGSTLMATAVTDLTGFGQMSLTPTSLGKINVKVESDEYKDQSLKTSLVKVGEITIESYVAPKLVVDYTPKPVYLDNRVTISVTAEGELTPGIPVNIVDPDGITLERTTTGAGTCTFTANKLGAWGIWAYYSEDDYEYISIDVLEYEQPELPAETTNEETLDSTGAPKTSFASGETVLVSAEVSNVGTESQSMLIVVQLKDPDYRVLAPSYISVTLEPGQSLTPSIGFALPMTGYTTGTWTAKVMVLDTWPALGGVTIGEPKTITFTVTS